MAAKVNRVKRFIQPEIHNNGLSVQPISNQFKELSHLVPDLSRPIKLEEVLEDHKDNKLFIEHNQVVIEAKLEDQVRILIQEPEKKIINSGGPTRVILSRPASSQQISNARPINVSFDIIYLLVTSFFQRVIQNVQPSQQTIVRQQPTHTVIQRSQPIQQTKVCLFEIPFVFIYISA